MINQVISKVLHSRTTRNSSQALFPKPEITTNRNNFNPANLKQSLDGLLSSLNIKVPKRGTKKIPTKFYKDKQLTRPLVGKRKKLLSVIHLAIFNSPTFSCRYAQESFAIWAGCSLRYVQSSIPLFIARGELEAHFNPRHDYDRSATLSYRVPLESKIWKKMRALRASNIVPAACCVNLFVHLMSKEFIYKLERETNVHDETTKEERESKEREIVTYSNQIPSYLDLVKNVKLTKWGKIRLSPYPWPAISYADENVPKRTGPESNFQKMNNLCVEYCHNNGITPNWSLGSALQSSHPELKGTPTEIVTQPSGFIKPFQERDGSHVTTRPTYQQSTFAPNPNKWTKRQDSPSGFSQGTPAQTPSMSQADYDALPADVIHPRKFWKPGPVTPRATQEELAAARDPNMSPMHAYFFDMGFSIFDKKKDLEQLVPNN